MWVVLPAVGLPLGAAWLLVRAAWPGPAAELAARVVQGGLVVGLGLGLSSCAFVVASVIASPSRRAAIVADLALLAVIGLLAWRSGALPRESARVAAAEAPTRGSGADGTAALLRVAVALVAVGAGIAFLVRASSFPHGGWDGWAIWNLRARFLFRGGEHWRDAFSPLLAWSHPDYPLLLPGAVARGWAYLGRETALVPGAVAALFTAATLLLLGAGLSLLRGSRQGWLGALLLLGTPAFVWHAASLYADLPVAFFLLAALTLLAIHDRIPGMPPGLVVLAGAMGALCAFTKNEGSLALLALLLARVVVLGWAHGWGAAARGMAPLVGGVLPVVALLAYFRGWLAPASEWVAALQDPGAVLDRLRDVGRYARIGAAVTREIGGFGDGIVPVAVLLLAHAILQGRRRETAALTGVATAGLTLGLILTGDVAAYLVSPYDLAWHLGTSLWRLIFQLWPSAILVYGLIIRPPGESA